jgi:protein-arginine kinase activator protein McsA
MKCDNCGKDFEELSTSGLNNGNKDDGWYCDDCYKEIHEEK